MHALSLGGALLGGCARASLLLQVLHERGHRIDVGEGAGVDVDPRVADELRGPERTGVVLGRYSAVRVGEEGTLRPVARADGKPRPLPARGHLGDPGTDDFAKCEQVVDSLAVTVVAGVLGVVDGDETQPLDDPAIGKHMLWE